MEMYFKAKDNKYNLRCSFWRCSQTVLCFMVSLIKEAITHCSANGIKDILLRKESKVMSDVIFWRDIFFPKLSEISFNFVADIAVKYLG
jgi:hypothetical protein